MSLNHQEHGPRDGVVRQPRLREIRPMVIREARRRRPRRIFTAPFILFVGFAVLIIVGGILLSLPLASSQGDFTPLVDSFFTAVSAVTLTGHSTVNVSLHWSFFGQMVIFLLVLIGGLSFLTFTTFLLALIGHRSTLAERLVMREVMSVDTMGGLRQMGQNIILVVFVIYFLGAVAIFARVQGVEGMGPLESAWHSLFTAVSAFNNAGFSILPESPEGSGLAQYGSDNLLLGVLMILIILGGIGWLTLVDIYRHRRFSRLSLDTKLILTTSLFLWTLGALVLFLAEYSNLNAPPHWGIIDRLENALFHSVSARTAGFASIDLAVTADFTKLAYSSLMFIGGAAGSVAGGIKVGTFALIIAIVLSAFRGRANAEAFGREIAIVQVHRAVTVALLAAGLVFLATLVLILAEPEMRFIDLLFDVSSAFATTGLSTGAAAQLSELGKGVLMAVMFVGRLGPLTLALALVPQEQATLYRYAQERVKIG